MHVMYAPQHVNNNKFRTYAVILSIYGVQLVRHLFCPHTADVLRTHILHTTCIMHVLSRYKAIVPTSCSRPPKPQKPQKPVFLMVFCIFGVQRDKSFDHVTGSAATKLLSGQVGPHKWIK